MAGRADRPLRMARLLMAGELLGVANRTDKRIEAIAIDVQEPGRIARAGHRMLGGQSARARPGSHRQANQLGWEFVHVAIDDATRLAYVEVLDEKALTAIGFLRRAAAHFASDGMTVEQLITARPTTRRSTRSPAARWASAICALGPTARRPTAKAERFIRTMLGGWAYGAIYRDSHQRTAALNGWLDFYNRHRPHGALGHKPPIARLHEQNNLLGSYN